MKEANQNYDAAHKVWVKGMMDMRQEKGTPIYTDVNSTLRLTYGQVLSYEPADGVVYDAHTTLKGCLLYTSVPRSFMTSIAKIKWENPLL